MTSIAVTARKCASASEVALLVACFMPFLPRPGMTRRCAQSRKDRQILTRNTPLDAFALCRPQAANIDCAKVEQ